MNDSAWEWMKLPAFLEKELWRMGLHVARTVNRGPVYEDILRIRVEAFHVPLGAAAADGDEISELYCAYHEDRPVAALRGTRASAGPMDCEEFYPRGFVERFRDVVVSASRFCAVDNRPPGVNAALALVKAAWADQLSRGMRFDVINSHERMVPYYRRLGYLLVRDSFFLHPRWATPSYVLVLPADASRPGPMQPLFAGVMGGVRVEALREVLSWCECSGGRRSVSACPCLSRPEATGGMNRPHLERART